MTKRDKKKRGEQDQRHREQDPSAPSPSALLPTLDERQLSVLRRIGRAWGQVCGDPEVWRDALPVDPSLGSYPDATEIQPTRFGRFVRVSMRNGQLPAVEATSAAEVPPSLLGRVGYHLRRVLLGAPLKSTAIAHERMRKLVALPVLSADALSSIAYGPEAMLAILVLGGSGGLSYGLPIAATIAFLMLAVGVSYRQTIRAYPHGGGSYIVASDNLGRVPGLVAAAGLLTDYILTVAVSGVAAITSRVAQCPHDVDVDGQPADRAVRGHDRAGPSRRRGAKCERDRSLAARPSQFRLGIPVRLHAGGDGGDPAARGEHRLQRLPARAVPTGTRPVRTAALSAHGRSPRLQQRDHPALGRSDGDLRRVRRHDRPLIPLFAVGVFLAFTMSQAGMVVHWWRLRDAHWRRSLFFNATGGVLSAIVFITAGITKFTAGAWVAVLTVGLFMLVAMRIRHHYDLASKALALQAGAIEVPRHTLAPSAAEGAAREHRVVASATPRPDVDGDPSGDRRPALVAPHPTQSDRAATTACAPTPAQDRRHDHPVPPTELESARPEATRARRAQCPTSGNC